MTFGLWSGLMLGASALVKESGVFFLPVVAAWAAWRDRGTGVRRLAGAALVSVGALVVVVPWIVHIQRPDLPFALVTRTGYMNLFIGNHPVSHGHGMREYPTLGATRLEAESEARIRALAEIRRRMPGWPFEKVAEQVPRFFTPTSFAVRRLLAPPDEPNGWGYRFTWAALDRPGPRVALVALVVASYAAALVLGALGLVLSERRDLAALLGLFVAAQLLPSIATFAMSRFRLAAMICFLIGAASFLVHGPTQWRAASPAWRAAAVSLALLMVFFMALDYESVLESTGR